ncbi:MAG: hypothetical protein ACTJHU_04575 [Mycetocola sp.]
MVASNEQAPNALILTGEGRPPSFEGEGLVSTHAGRVGWEWVALQRTDEHGANTTVERVQKTGAVVHRAAHARIQPGLDLWDAPGGQRRSIGIVEYVHSQPATRESYYRSQEEVSGPAMRELWAGGLVQRFVGAEIVTDLLSIRAGEPEWDLLHLTSFPLTALPRMLSWTQLFDKHAQAAGLASMAALKQQWQSQRSMVKSQARIYPFDGSAAGDA